jgi:Tol biopolymer transport system component
MKIPVDGGTPEVIQGSVVSDGYITGGMNLSPDGRWLPGVESLADPKTKALITKVALIKVDSDSPASTKILIPRPDITRPIAFTVDGKAVVYSIVEDGVGNVWEQPLNGSRGHRVTNFSADHMSAFQYSPDGKSIAVAREHTFPMSYSCATRPLPRTDP